MPAVHACEDDEVSINLMRLRRICPRWIDDGFPSTNCWCHSSKQDDGKTANCPTKPADWKPGMSGVMEEPNK